MPDSGNENIDFVMLLMDLSLTDILGVLLVMIIQTCSKLRPDEVIGLRGKEVKVLYFVF